MAVDLQQIQRLARQVQDGTLKREDFQAQVAALKSQAMSAGRAATVQRIAPSKHLGSPIVESGPDIRAGARTFSLTLALLALAVIAVAAVTAARGDAPRMTLPRFELPRLSIPDASNDRRRAAERTTVEEAPAKPPAAEVEPDAFDPARVVDEALRESNAAPLGEAAAPRPTGPKPEPAKP